MTYKEKTERYNSATAQALVAKWNDANDRMNACKQEMEEAQDEMVRDVCPYKVGEVFVNKDGKKYVLTKITADTYSLRGGFGGTCAKFIDFSYKFVAIRKDGKPSMNGTSWVNIDECERTGETIDV